jgi:hypothetical protein
MVLRPRLMRWLVLYALTACAPLAETAACPSEPHEVSGGKQPPAEEEEAREAFRPNPALADLPRGRAIGELEADACRALLRGAGVEVEVPPARECEAVEQPVIVREVGGIAIEHRGRSRRHSIMDCRLAVALLAWSDDLRRAGIEKLVHYSAYRPGAHVRSTGALSGHATGLAIDIGVFERDAAPLDVLAVWTDRRRGVPPCPPSDASEPADQAVLRSVVCRAVSRDLFQVVLTPHHDEAHKNHVHVELRPRVDWSFVE